LPPSIELEFAKRREKEGSDLLLLPLPLGIDVDD
jgi:hypothetical protein